MDSITLSKEILEEVEGLICGDRAASYGDAFDSFTRIGKRLDTKGSEVALMLLMTKLDREDFKHKKDNLVDMVGYAVLYAVCKYKENEK